MNHLDNRMFNEEYFMKRFGDGLPPMAYVLLAEKANVNFNYHLCLSKIKKRGKDNFIKNLIPLETHQSNDSLMGRY